MFAAPMVHDTNVHQTCLALHQNSRGDKDFIGDNILFKALPSIYDVTESCDYCLKKTPIREMFERVLDRLQFDRNQFVKKIKLNIKASACFR